MELLTNAVIEAIERGWLPDSVTRWLTRRLCDQRLQKLRQKNVSTEHFAEQMKNAPVAPVPEKANEQHYELPAEFFELMLGPRLKYSCCHFENDTTTLEKKPPPKLVLQTLREAAEQWTVKRAQGLG